MAAFNGSGTYVRTYDWTDDAGAGVKIRADRMDVEMDGIATALSTCILKDGTQTITANIPMNSKKFTGLAAGTSSGDSVEYSQLDELAMPRGHIAGLEMSNGTDATNDIDISMGEAKDSTDAYNLVLAAAITKRLDGSWAVGDGEGGLDTGSIANTTYHVWLIARSDTGVVDALFSASPTSPTMPANYDYKRRVGSFVRESGSIVPFYQRGDVFLKDLVNDVNVSNLGTSATLYTLSVPTGIQVEAIVDAAIQESSLTATILTSPDSADIDPASSIFNLYSVSSIAIIRGFRIRTNTSAQVRARSTAANTSMIINTAGWIDTRGRFD